ncbi:hypothetical protein [Parvularcula lutaonensis]|uniref:Uncharacterized protein n=1 Tax=Parvularcula lutaonensis TaxID=491923 RepID=A0ABV7MAA9_9PROT|nr:hypothetical protein [Parvularcula lutaonensis]GGY37387.1 hypothetical protein GCM10007148_02020 [Parvularcula lutaonensis]
MTRIETIFGGLLAAGILAVFAFVFFGSAGSSTASASSAASETPRARLMTKASLSGLLSDDPEDYVAPTKPCECYFLGYDMVRERIGPESVIFEGQLQTCYDNLGAKGAAALERGAMDASAEPRQRRSCRPDDYR